ncbi:putative DnaJ-like protein subfamily A member 5 [Podospora fimiseda]|uniref:DnaJ-like protein subfamily A member 5 n=1 Tax=Podospora fimiseda TaxID=252190 RepID=A0AAN7GXQ9_9PEZI|nr:putative DnaJ-like protein subfamily A member 5 [Podospora fimiseda]
MGAEQSAPRGGSSSQKSHATPHKTCYYELLGIERDAPDDAIRKAYKKKALELHPDRNYNDEEYATKKFAEVQTAYEILSDPQERAWYDTHRDAILSGDDNISGGTPQDPSGGSHTSANAIFALMSRFNSRVPMDNSPNGFFGILNLFFEQLATEEAKACEWDGIKPTNYPPFGGPDDDYNTVAKPFYNVWSAFSTKKSFSWRDKYRLSDAPDRRIRRLMEKDNKKCREDGIREFNDAVISLVAFVKKRDPRYVPNTQSEAERQQALRNSAAAQAARSRAVHQEKMSEYVVPDWAQPREKMEHEGEFSLDESESEIEEIECVVCNKTFRSEKQFESHEKSKKHIKAVQQLKRQMKKENANLDLDSPAISTPQTPNVVSDEEEDIVEPEEQVTQVPPSPPEEPDAAEERTPSTLSTEDDIDDEYAPRAEVEDRILNGDKGKLKAPPSTDDLDTTTANLKLDDEEEKAPPPPSKKIGKAKLKREKKAARQANEVEAAESHKCTVCREAFPSRSKLFAHIKQLDHAMAPAANSNPTGKNKKKR